MLRVAAVAMSVALSAPAWSYPIDGYEYSGIRRLEFQQQIQAGLAKGNMLPPGALLSIDQVQLNLVDISAADAPDLARTDSALQAKLEALLPGRDASYAVALLEITPGQPSRYAARGAQRAMVPGSVGKLAVAGGLFAELARLYPDDIEKRRTVLRERMVRGGKWVISDHHTIPHFDPASGKGHRALPTENDLFSLYEWTDHMLSPSANAAASVVWKELVLMRVFGDQYPPSAEQEKDYWANTPKREITPIVMSTVNDPLREIGIAEADWRLGNLFTRMGKQLAPGGGGSKASPQGLMQWLVALERGAVVDPWSSRELKRLMYSTERRIRYASAPALANHAVYFKSGSQYKCQPEPDFKCEKYKGNVENYMNSVAIVEQAEQGRVYLVVLMSNVLRKNSAVDHQTLAAQIEKVMAAPD